MTKAVTVVIPTFNSARLVNEAVDSALRQTHRPHEIIVVDDGSTDGTAEALSRWVPSIKYISQPNGGVAFARNTGVAAATGNLIGFLDADDIWHPQKLEVQLRALDDTPKVGALGTDTFQWPGAFLPQLPNVAPAIDMVPWPRLAIQNVFTTSSMLVRRDVLARVGPFDTTLKGPEDHDLWLRIVEMAPAGIIRLPLTGYRDSAGSLSKQARQMEDGMRRILFKLDDRDAWHGRWLLRRAARAYTDYSCAYMYSAAGEPAVAWSRVQQSLLQYPLPYRKGVMRVPLARLRLAAALLLRMTGLRTIAR